MIYNLYNATNLKNPLDDQKQREKKKYTHKDDKVITR